MSELMARRQQPPRLPAFVALHPMHPRAFLPSAFWGQPAAWRAPSDGGVLGRVCGYPWAWGLPPLAGVSVEDAANRLRVLNYYGNSALLEPERVLTMLHRGERPPEAVSPQVSFARELARLKSTSLREPAALAAVAGCTFTLRISLCGSTGPGAPDSDLPLPVFRLLALPGNTSLHHVAELCAAAMGWSARAHAYYFVDRRDGSLFGDAKSTAVDFQCCAPLHAAWAWVDDTQVCLAHLLSAVGDRTTWLYDLGECWQHTLCVESISAGSAPPRLLAGEGACPGEDWSSLPLGGGASGYAELMRMSEPDHLAQLGIAQRRAWQKELAIIFDDASNARNYSQPRTGPRRTFNLRFKYDIKVAAADVAVAVADAGLDVDYHTRTNMPNPAMRFGSNGHRACRVCGKEAADCGQLKVCGGCRRVDYCSEVCSRADWGPRHKAECREMTEQHRARKKESQRMIAEAKELSTQFIHAGFVNDAGKTLIICMRGEGGVSDSTNAPLVRPLADCS